MPTYKQPVKQTDGHLKVVELFETIQGEGQYIGVPSVFFRTGACNLECAGCDTKWDAWLETPIQECAQRILAFKSNHVVITGGEPLLWQKQLGELLALLEDRVVTVETNGAVPLTDKDFIQRVNLFSFSPKVGTLGFEQKFSRSVVLDNLLRVGYKSQLKYVLDPNISAHVACVFAFQDKVDALWFPPSARRIADEEIFFQPYDRGTLVNIYARQVAFNPNDEYNRDLALLAKTVMEHSGCRFRTVPQLHKYITWR